MKRNFWINLILVLIGVVIGSVVVELTQGVSWLRWLSYGLSFGTDSPLVLNLSVFGLTLGAWLKITIADIIFIVLSLLIGRLLMRRR